MSTDAIVLFQHGTRHWFGAFLRPGFRHCAIIIKSGDDFVLLDPNIGYIRTVIIKSTEAELLDHYAEQKILAVKTQTREPSHRIPLVYGNCVGLVKVMLGINNPFIITPHQLYKAIR